MYNQLKDVKEELSDVVQEGANRTEKLKRQIHELVLKNREMNHDSEEKITEKNEEVKNLKNLLKSLEI